MSFKYSAKSFPLTVAALAGFGSAAHAVCIVDPAGKAPTALHAIEANPGRTLAQAQARLGQTRDWSEIGWLWATIATAELLLDRPDEASQAARQGLAALEHAPQASARPQLQVIDAAAVETEAQARDSISSLGKLRSTMAAGSAADICTLLAIGTLEHVIDAPGEATRDITASYRMSLRPGRERERAFTAMTMAAVLRRAGDEEGARALMNESIAQARSNDLPITLSNSLYQAGLFQIDRKDYARALVLLDEAADIAQRLQGVESAAYMKMGACEAHLGLGNLGRAASLCGDAAGPMSGTLSAGKILWLQARIALAQRHPADAVRLLDKVVDRKNQVATTTVITDALETRARARAALGDMAGAYADLSTHLSRTNERYRTVMTTRTAQMRERMKTDREEAKNAVLANRIHLATERDRAQKRLIAVLGSAVVIILVLLIALIWLSRRHRRRLEDIAETDVLTGLPNRRAIERHAASNRAALPASIALLDLDHFKTINDVHGHAVGDRALQIFARAARATLRASDMIGRWGGEEFLAIFPDTAPDQAAAILERLRAVLREEPYEVAAGLNLEFSAGIAADTKAADGHGRLLAETDAALYLAKAGGRARSVISGADVVRKDVVLA